MGSIFKFWGAALGQRERAVLLQVGGDQILIGVASGNVTALHHLSENVSVTDTEGSLSFKDVCVSHGSKGQI